MAMVVKNNLPAKNTLNQLDKNDKALAKSLKKVASGMKINSAEDDASGYSIAEKMTVQIRSLNQDEANVQNGSSMLKVASGAMESTAELLTTLKEKVINAANDTNTDADRQIIQKELDQAINQIDDNANVTYNGQIMLDGSKNNVVVSPGTYTHLANESLAEGTTRTTYMTQLAARDGENLGISVGDSVTVSYVRDGETYTNTITVASNTRFASMFNWSPCSSDLVIASYLDSSQVGVDQYGNAVYTADGGEAITYKAKNPGVDGQIAGLTIRVEDNQGNVRKSTNRILDNFNETVRAQNPTDDNALVFQTGTKANVTVKAGFTDMRSMALGLKGSGDNNIDITSQVKANAAISVLDNALSKVLNQQTTVGALLNKLEHTEANIVTASENTQASESVIRDADMAKEMTAYTKNNVLLQASQSMLAQANQNSSSVLSLLQ